MANNIIEIEVEIDGKKGLARLERDAFESGKKAGENTSEGFVDGLASAKGKIVAVATAIASVLAGAFNKKAIEAAIEQEDAINRLNLALGRSGQFTQAFSQEMSTLASSIQAATGFADDAILSGAALLQTMSKLDKTNLKDATQAAVDLAAAYKIDVESAFTIVGRAVDGHVTQLNKMGIEVRRSSNDAEMFSNAMKAIQGAVGGAAAKDINTFSGSIKLMRASFGDFLEEVGNITIKSPALIGVIKGLGKVFENLAGVIAKGSMAKSFNDFVLMIVRFGSDVIGPYMIRPLQRVLEVGDFVFKSLKVLVNSATVAFASFGTLVAGILNKLGIVSDETDKTLQRAYQTSIESQRQFVAEAKSSFADIGTGTWGEFVAKQFETIRLSAETTKLAVQEVINAPQLDPFVKKFEDAKIKIDQILQQGLMKGISSSMQMIGASLVKGGSAFENFGNMVLGIIGDMAINIGETLVALGLGIDQLKLALTFMTGGLAIAAGLALIAVGGALKSLAGGAASGAAAGAATGGAPSAVAPTESVSPTAFESQQRKTEIVVNVDGNIFNGRDQAMAIVENLQEYFDMNAGVLVR